MCGIVGFWKIGVENNEVLKKEVSVMTDTLSYRGPDDKGIYVNEKGIALGHRRLSIFGSITQGSSAYGIFWWQICNCL